MAPPHVIVIDLDGTLVDSSGSISIANRRAIEHVQASGCTVLVATGRTWSECHALLDEAGLSGPLITAGGSRLTTHPANTTTHRVALADATAITAAQMLVAHGLGVLVLVDPDPDGVEYLHLGPHDLHTVSHWWHGQHGHLVHPITSSEEVTGHGAVLRIAALGDAQALESPAIALQGALGDKARIWHWEAVTDPQRGHAPVHLLEVFGPRAGKWPMVQRWCAANGHDTSQVMAIGDGLNDVELIQHVGLGIAVANADARVRAVADCIVASNDDDGVARALLGLLDGTLGVGV